MLLLPFAVALDHSSAVAQAPRQAVLLAQAMAPAGASQITPAGDGTQVIPTQQGFSIQGGTQAGKNLFHQFEQFRLGAGQVADFVTLPEIENILGRVTGGQSSLIDGLLQLSGSDANLFLLNPAGVVFGPNAQLNLPASFTVSTGDRLFFGDAWLELFGENDYSQLTGNPDGIGFSLDTAGAIVNQANLTLKPGQALNLIGGSINSTGGLTVRDGQVRAWAVPGAGKLSLGSGLTVDWSAIAHPISGLPANFPTELTPEMLRQLDPDLDNGDIAVAQLDAGEASLTAGKDLLLHSSDLRSSGDMLLGAEQRLQIRDAAPGTAPLNHSSGNAADSGAFIAQAGGELRMQGSGQIDILALENPETLIYGGSGLNFISDGIISADAHLWSGGDINLLNSKGQSGNFVSLYDPIIRSFGNVSFGNYTGVALKVEAEGEITAGDITITGADAVGAIPPSDPDFIALTTRPSLILRAGAVVTAPNPSFPVSAGTPATTFNEDLPAIDPPSINTGFINTSPGGPVGGIVELTAPGDIVTGLIATAANLNGAEVAEGGDVTIEAGGNAILGSIITSGNNTLASATGGDVTITAGGNIEFETIFSQANAGGVGVGTGAQVSLSAGQVIRGTDMAGFNGATIQATGSTTPGSISIEHSGGINNVPFIVGGGGINNGTAGALYIGPASSVTNEVFDQPGTEYRNAPGEISITYNNQAPVVGPPPTIAGDVNQPIIFTYDDLTDGIVTDPDGDVSIALVVTSLGSGQLEINDVLAQPGDPIFPGDTLTYTPPVDTSGVVNVADFEVDDGLEVAFTPIDLQADIQAAPPTPTPEPPTPTPEPPTPTPEPPTPTPEPPTPTPEPPTPTPEPPTPTPEPPTPTPEPPTPTPEPPTPTPPSTPTESDPSSLPTPTPPSVPTPVATTPLLSLPEANQIALRSQLQTPSVGSVSPTVRRATYWTEKTILIDEGTLLATAPAVSELAAVRGILPEAPFLLKPPTKVITSTQKAPVTSSKANTWNAPVQIASFQEIQSLDDLSPSPTLSNSLDSGSNSLDTGSATPAETPTSPPPPKGLGTNSEPFIPGELGDFDNPQWMIRPPTMPNSSEVYGSGDGGGVVPPRGGAIQSDPANDISPRTLADGGTTPETVASSTLVDITGGSSLVDESSNSDAGGSAPGDSASGDTGAHYSEQVGPRFMPPNTINSGANYSGGESAGSSDHGSGNTSGNTSGNASMDGATSSGTLSSDAPDAPMGGDLTGKTSDRAVATEGTGGNGTIALQDASDSDVPSESGDQPGKVGGTSIEAAEAGGEVSGSNGLSTQETSVSQASGNTSSGQSSSQGQSSSPGQSSATTTSSSVASSSGSDSPGQESGQDTSSSGSRSDSSRPDHSSSSSRNGPNGSRSDSSDSNSSSDSGNSSNSNGSRYSDGGDSSGATTQSSSSEGSVQSNGEPSEQADSGVTAEQEETSSAASGKAPNRETAQTQQTIQDCVAQEESLRQTQAGDRQQKRYDKLIDCYQQVLDQASGDLAQEIYALNNIGIANFEIGNYLPALQAHRSQLERAKQLGNATQVGIAFTGLGAAYAGLGETDQAIAHYQQALEQLPQEQALEWRSLTLRNLGNAYLAQQDYDVALRYQQESLQLARQQGDRHGEMQALANLGNSYTLTGEFDEGIAHYQQALSLAKTLGAQLEEAQTLMGLATAYSFQQDYESAIAHNQQSLPLLQQLQNRLGEGIVLTNLGDAQYKLRQLTAAESTLRQGMKVWESLRAGLGNNDAYKISLFETQVALYQTFQEVLVDQQKAEEALEISERSRGRAFVELLARENASKESQQHAGVAPPNLAQLRKIAQEQHATIVEYTLAKDQIVALPHGASKQYRSESNSSEGVPHKLLIWVLQPSGAVEVRQVDLVDWQREQRQDVIQLIATARHCMNDSGCSRQRTRGFSFNETVADGLAVEAEPVVSQPPMAGNAPLNQLHQLLIEPIADLLPQAEEERVIFVPHDQLFLVPFPALRDRNGTYLVEQHTIQTTPAIQLLDGTRRRRQQLNQVNERALVVGNPAPMPNNFTPLPFTQTEAEAIAQHLNTEPLIGAAASETAIKQQLSQAGIIHLATHGTFDAENPLAGAIALAPDTAVNSSSQSSPGEDGLLTAQEILDLRLNAALVVLSACDTGRGKITGDGVIGLSRSFLGAGAASVMVSLWQVPDDATSLLMKSFYEQREQGLDHAQALRQAMLAVKTVYDDPKSWSGFTLMGESR